MLFTYCKSWLDCSNGAGKELVRTLVTCSDTSPDDASAETCLVIIDVCGHNWHNFGEKVRLDESRVADLGAACMLMAS